MAVTLDDFGNYTNQPEMNVSLIYQQASAYAKQIRIFTVLVSGTVPIKSAAPYGWGVPSRETLGGGGASAASRTATSSCCGGRPTCCSSSAPR